MNQQIPHATPAMQKVIDELNEIVALAAMLSPQDEALEQPLEQLRQILTPATPALAH